MQNNYKSLQYKSDAFILSHLMAYDPKKNPLFKCMKVNICNSSIINQLADKCPICTNRIKNPVKLQNCIHIYCTKCIKPWLKSNSNCPICRVPSRFYSSLILTFDKKIFN